MKLVWSKSVHELDARAWASLGDAQNVYLSLPWLRATGSGWAAPQPCLTAWEGEELLAALPTYLVERVRGGLYDPGLLFEGVLCQDRRTSCPYPFLLAGSRSGYATEVALSPSLDARDGGALAIVQDTGSPGRGAELEEVDPDAVVFRPDDVLGADAGLAGVVGDQPAERVVRQARHPGGGATEAGDADRGVQLRPADLHVEAAGLLQAAAVGRGQANHRLAECDDV